MIKASKKAIKYASFYEVTLPLLNDLGEKKVINMLKSMPKTFKFPKNTLKIKYKNYFLGHHGDSFVKNVNVVLINYIVYTFKIK